VVRESPGYYIEIVAQPPEHMNPFLCFQRYAVDVSDSANDDSDPHDYEDLTQILQGFVRLHFNIVGVFNIVGIFNKFYSQHYLP